jgi:hypothetical protein
MGCKGKTKIQDTPETLEQLENCRNRADERQKWITTLEGKLAELREGAGDEGEVVVNVTGDGTVEIVAGRGPNQTSRPKEPVATAADKELYEAFIKKVNGSRGQMRKCYQNALKKDSSLTARTITLHVTVRYRANGKVARADFDKRLTPAFGSCMTAVARDWRLPPTPRGVTFKTPVTLTPQ